MFIWLKAVPVSGFHRAIFASPGNRNEHGTNMVRMKDEQEHARNNLSYTEKTLHF
jgi:hypothetical protein